MTGGRARGDSTQRCASRTAGYSVAAAPASVTLLSTMRHLLRPLPAGLLPVWLFVCAAAPVVAQTPTTAQAPETAQAPAEAAAVDYVLSFPEPHERWMQVAMTVDGLGDRPLEVRMSRTSPGRYARHDFAKNVWAVTATDGAGHAVPVTRTDPSGWNVPRHDGTVTVRYKVYGDRIDGTYLSVDATHAHMNVPATLMFPRGFESRAARVTLRQPPGRQWTAATQLYATGDPLVFTAPNQAYLADSPIEFGEITLLSFTAPAAGRTPPQTIRVALHHQGTLDQARTYLQGVQRIVAEMQALFGELPVFEPGQYTFLADYLPWANGDGMEHRNSTVLTSSASLASGSPWLLATVAHEFVHVWNVERIRPASLEPFDFDDSSLSGELWFAEGVSSYLDGLVMQRAGLVPIEAALARWSGLVNAVTTSPATALRSAVEMSRLASFVDGAPAVDRTNHDNTYLSYYAHGAAIGLALDLTLRGASQGRVSLDDYMRALWNQFGAVAGAPGTVARPYTLRDLRDVLAGVSGDRGLADRFFDRHVEGREPFDWPALFAPVGIAVERLRPGAATLGEVAFDFSQQTARVSRPTPFGSPAYAAGLAQDDVLEDVGGTPIVSAESLRTALAARTPGDEVTLRYLRRHGERVTATTRLVEAREVRLLRMEEAGAAVPSQALAMREAWLRSRVP